MVPDIAKTGHSFKGAMAYYLHDKREDAASPHLSTSDRVAWTETRNLATDGPHTAARIMIATAQQSDSLKAAAGVKATGQKSKAHVYAYSLAWHPDEAAKLTRDEMRRAADSSLVALGATDRQAVIVCHTDRGHPHVHVIVNRVHPETGRMLSTSNDRHKLDEWAWRYEKERGLIVTPDRAAKFEKIEQKRQRYSADERKAYVDSAKARAAADAEARRSAFAKVKTPEGAAFASAALANARAAGKPPSQGQMLKDFTDAQKIRHKEQWADLSARSKAQKDAIYQAVDQQIKAAIAKGWTDARPSFADLKGAAKDEWREHGRSFWQAEKSLGKAQLGVGGQLVGAFALSFAKGLARGQLAQAQAARREAVAGQARAAIDRQIADLKAARSEALKAQREQFSADRAALIEKQNAERDKTRAAWRQLYERTGRAPIRPQNARPAQEPRKDMKEDFSRRASGLPNAPKAAHEMRFVSTPQPAPAPAGAPPIAAKTAQPVPVNDRAGKVGTAQPSPQPAKAWTEVAPPAAPSHADIWAKAAEKPSASREIKPLPTRGKDRDR